MAIDYDPDTWIYNDPSDLMMKYGITDEYLSTMSEDEIIFHAKKRIELYSFIENAKYTPDIDKIIFNWHPSNAIIDLLQVYSIVYMVKDNPQIMNYVLENETNLFVLRFTNHMERIAEDEYVIRELMSILFGKTVSENNMIGVRWYYGLDYHIDHPTKSIFKNGYIFVRHDDIKAIISLILYRVKNVLKETIERLMSIIPEKKLENTDIIRSIISKIREHEAVIGENNLNVILSLSPLCIYMIDMKIANDESPGFYEMTQMSLYLKQFIGYEDVIKYFLFRDPRNRRNNVTTVEDFENTYKEVTVIIKHQYGLTGGSGTNYSDLKCRTCQTDGNRYCFFTDDPKYIVDIIGKMYDHDPSEKFGFDNDLIGIYKKYVSYMINEIKQYVEYNKYGFACFDELALRFLPYYIRYKYVINKEKKVFNGKIDIDEYREFMRGFSEYLKKYGFIAHPRLSYFNNAYHMYKYFNDIEIINEKKEKDTDS